ncbi:MAG: hypothetical protein M3Y77_03470 [Actinomycetota bacterium]|nr:hypothetical protein [Actinomycetota bacterium]
MDNFTQVLAGTGAGDLAWAVSAGAVEGAAGADEFVTLISRTQGGKTATSGFRGPKLYPGDLINYWVGKAVGPPVFVLVRADPKVVQCAAVCMSRARYSIDLSDEVPQFGLRFGALQVLQGEQVVGVVPTTTTDIRPINRFR